MPGRGAVRRDRDVHLVAECGHEVKRTVWYFTATRPARVRQGLQAGAVQVGLLWRSIVAAAVSRHRNVGE